MRINHNIQALNAYRQLSQNQATVSKHLEKLSSGLRINRASDDAAGLAISEKMRSQIRGLGTAERNALDGISLIQTAEGALDSMHSILQRMRELAVQSANGTLEDQDRSQIQNEINQLTTELDRISTSTEFNKRVLLDGSISSDYEGVELDPESNVNYGGTGLSDLKIALDSQLDPNKTYTIEVKDDSGVFKATLMEDGAAITSDIPIVSGQSYDFGNGVAFSVGNSIQEDKVAFDVISTTADKSLFMQIGANEGQGMSIGISNMSARELGLASDGAENNGDYDRFIKDPNRENTGEPYQYVLNLSDAKSAGAALDKLDEAITKVSTERSKLGAIQNRLEHTTTNLSQTSENLTAAESRIRDADMAIEMANFTKNNIINQAATAMLAQANQLPQGILQLLK